MKHYIKICLYVYVSLPFLFRIQCSVYITSLCSVLLQQTFIKHLSYPCYSMSVSTLSISSGSSLGSLGSLGSLSDSTRGSYTSLSLSDINSSGSNLQDLHRRVEKILQGHSSSISPIHENPVSIHPDVMAAATGGYLESVLGSCNQDSVSSVSSSVRSFNLNHKNLKPSSSGNIPSLVTNVPGASVSVPVLIATSSHSSLSSLSPPISPYEVGCPPPSYNQHMNIGVPNMPSIAKPPPPYVPAGRPAPPPPFSASVNMSNLNTPPYIPQINSNQSKAVLDAMYVNSQSKTDPANCSGAWTPNNAYVIPTQGSDVNSEPVNTNSNIIKRIQHVDNLDISSNPPLSPISESSSGVCNNLSGGNTRSVSAAVSDESVAGDSGVFDAVVKR